MSDLQDDPSGISDHPAAIRFQNHPQRGMQPLEGKPHLKIRCIGYHQIPPLRGVSACQRTYLTGFQTAAKGVVTVGVMTVSSGRVAHDGNDIRVNAELVIELNSSRSMSIVYIGRDCCAAEMGMVLMRRIGHRSTAMTGLFFWGGKIGRLLKFCQSHVTPLSGTAKCDLEKFKEPAVTFWLLVKIVQPHQWEKYWGHHPCLKPTNNLFRIIGN